MKGERTVEKRRVRNTKKSLLDIYSKYGIILILIGTKILLEHLFG